MKRVFFLGMALVVSVTVIYAQVEKKGIYFDLSAGYGISGSTYTFVPAEDFGDMYFGDSTLFSDKAEYTNDFAKRMSIGLDYYLTDRVALDFGIGYSNKMFTHIYAKNTAANDYKITASYEFLEISGGLKCILFKSLYVGGGITFNHILSVSSYETLGSSAIVSPLVLSEDNLGAYLDIGKALRFKNDNIVYIYLKYNSDIDPVFPFEYDVSEISLAYLTLNIAVAVPL